MSDHAGLDFSPANQDDKYTVDLIFFDHIAVVSDDTPDGFYEIVQYRANEGEISASDCDWIITYPGDACES